MGRPKTGTLRTVEQLRVATAPATFEVFEALMTQGPLTISELGQRLGRPSNALHYHVRKLVGAHLVEQVDTRRSGSRDQAVYNTIADQFEGDPAPASRSMREATTAAVGALLRLAARDYARAIERRSEIRASGKDRNLLAHRRKAWLTKSDLAELNRHIDAIDEIFARSQGRRRGSLHAVTTVLTFLDPTGRRER